MLCLFVQVLVTLKNEKMKTKVIYLASKLTVAVVLLAIIAVKAFAGDTPTVKLVPHSENKALIAIDFLDEISQLTIEDKKGDIVYFRADRIENKYYSKIFDFKNLNSGEYKIIVKNKFGKNELLFEVENNKIKVINNKPSFEPFIEVKNNVLKLSFLNQNELDINFSIANKDGVFFYKPLGDDYNITTGFNITKLAKGEYTVSLSDGVNNYNYSFEK